MSRSWWHSRVGKLGETMFPIGFESWASGLVNIKWYWNTIGIVWTYWNYILEYHYIIWYWNSTYCWTYWNSFHWWEYHLILIFTVEYDLIVEYSNLYSNLFDTIPNDILIVAAGYCQVRSRQEAPQAQPQPLPARPLCDLESEGHQHCTRKHQ